MNLLSIITGTLNRKHLLPILIKNTVDSDNRIELVLIDGGSTDGSLIYLKNLNHPRIKLIEVGQRSPYPHYMNLGIRNASSEWICQWNDDVILITSWDNVFKTLDEIHKVYVFTWKKDNYQNYTDKDWIMYFDNVNENVMNYGIYHKDVFRQIGMYNNSYQYYCADGDMCFRAWVFGFKIKLCQNIKVIARKDETTQAKWVKNDFDIYEPLKLQYRQKILPSNLEFLK